MNYQRVSEVKQKERDCLENNARHQKGACEISSGKLRDFCKWKGVVVRLSAFKGHSLIIKIKALDFTTYPCT